MEDLFRVRAVRGTILRLVNGTILTHCRKLVLFYTSGFLLIIRERLEHALRKGWRYLLRYKRFQTVRKNLTQNKPINCEGETLEVINHPPAHWQVLGWKCSDLKGHISLDVAV